VFFNELISTDWEKFSAENLGRDTNKVFQNKSQQVKAWAKILNGILRYYFNTSQSRAKIKLSDPAEYLSGQFVQSVEHANS
jgi:hypothetical protein